MVMCSRSHRFLLLCRGITWIVDSQLPPFLPRTYFFSEDSLHSGQSCPSDWGDLPAIDEELLPCLLMARGLGPTFFLMVLMTRSSLVRMTETSSDEKLAMYTFLPSGALTVQYQL